MTNNAKRKSWLKDAWNIITFKKEPPEGQPQTRDCNFTAQFVVKHRRTAVQKTYMEWLMKEVEHGRITLPQPSLRERIMRKRRLGNRTQSYKKDNTTFCIDEDAYLTKPGKL